MSSHYDVLGIPPDSKLSRIKSAFRAKAKSLHPDLDRSGRHASAMRRVITAYEVLSDPEKRRHYDLLHSRRHSTFTFDYRTFLRERNDELSNAKLIFHDLLHGNEQDAVDLYVELGGLQSIEALDREDYMDCVFLLAEENEKQGGYLAAYELYMEVVRCELELPYFRHFFREVIDRIRFISCFEMPRLIDSEGLLEILRRLVEIDFSAQDSAYFLKKMAEIYAEQSSYALAVHCLNESLRLHAAVPGAKKLMERFALHAAG